MQKSKTYNISPAHGQALLNFQGRRYPDKIELFETEQIEQVRQKEKQKKLDLEKQSELNSDFRNLLIQGDCLSACAYLKSQDIKVDLVYIDPPFASGANYAKKLFLRTGGKDVVESDDVTLGEEVMYGDIWQKEDYLNWLYERLLAIRDIMSETASIYVHLDWHIGHYAKLLLDEVFGEENFRNEIIWRYRRWPTISNDFQKMHDTIFRYSKSDEYNWNQPFEELSESSKKQWKGKSRLDMKSDKGTRFSVTSEEESLGAKMSDVWDISQVTAPFSEYTDYATQKPEALLERIIKTSSNEGDIVADFFVGSGTTAKVAHNLGRKFVTCDIGINAIQTTRDRLVEAGAEFDILKVKDGVRLFRNPAQTTAKIFSLIDGFKSRKELELTEFWDGGIADKSGEYVPVKFVGIHERLTRELLDVVLEEIYQLQDASNNISTAQIIYAHKDDNVDQAFVNKQIKEAGKTNVKLELISLDDLLAQKRDLLFMPDSADIEISKEDKGFKVEIKKFFSPYLKTKIDEYNTKKVKNPKQASLDETPIEATTPHRKVSISETGLELIEAVQFDTTLKEAWTSNIELEDKAGVKHKIKGVYRLPIDKFRMKIRNIAGDEITIDSKDIDLSPKS